MLRTYLSPEHLGDVEGQCPLIALPSDVGRAGQRVRAAYGDLLLAMIGLYERALPDTASERRAKAMALAALSVGGMVLARTISDAELAANVRQAALGHALAMISPSLPAA